jgi:hypothetical protein
MSRNLLKLDHYCEQNEQAAEIILADVAEYGGEAALLVQWARLVQHGTNAVTKVRERAGLEPGQAERKGAA